MYDTAFMQHLSGLYGYAMALTRNDSEAQDLVQETCLRALPKLGSLRADSNLKSWLFTILRNIWLNQLRQKRSASNFAELDTDESIADLVQEPSQNPHDSYVGKMEREWVRQAIERLPVASREIILLREYEELSYQEIADVLECPPGTVMSRLARARSKLRSLLSTTDYFPAEPSADGEKLSSRSSGK
ncbi:RNA polymerase sigma-70 factor (ECF subfamily) [Silvibacterium bohemicum]|uniref:RNA polymerase sigma factor n=2 Tax=Silvibacterium bohemicum TaxID=1577686 RepID=A0A841K763_9BACT|nr:sigma-70 family RNA polymerase sigma factor [Silvibacterium bohemicum]MBB6146428.1 RNA polymerase sigma-70 factor (ECF subfamily) [Silvibacterium bohemicum]